MTPDSIISTLTRQGHIRQGHQLVPPAPGIDSGYPALNRLLGGGLPAYGVCQLKATTGIGEIRLLLPYLTHRAVDSSLVVLINPPGCPQADFWRKYGPVPAKVLSLMISDRRDLLWCLQQCLQSGCCNAVLVWDCEIETRHCKQLQHAAYAGNSSLWLCGEQTLSSIPLTLSLRASPLIKGIRVWVTKRKGGWPAGPVDIKWQDRWPEFYPAVGQSSQSASRYGELGY